MGPRTQAHSDPRAHGAITETGNWGIILHRPLIPQDIKKISKIFGFLGFSPGESLDSRFSAPRWGESFSFSNFPADGLLRVNT